MALQKYHTRVVLYALPLGSDAAWRNPCGGQGWRYDSRGLIELEGVGAPEYAPGHPRYVICANTWQNFRCEIADAALRHQLPISWVLAIASVETGAWSSNRSRQAGMVSPAGALGVMQIMPATAEGLGYAPEQMLQPAQNIDAGARLMAQLDARVEGGLPAICGPYNSGQLCCDAPSCRVGCQNGFQVCTASDYPGAAVRFNNTAIRYLQLGPCSRLGSLLGFGLIAVGVGGALKWADRRYH